MAQKMIKNPSSKKLTVRVIKDDITKVKADAVVTGEGSLLDRESAVTKALAGVLPQLRGIRNRIKIEKGGLDLWTAHVSPLGSGFRFKYVIHAVLDKGNTDKWLRFMKSLYKKIFKEADRNKISSIALPVLGSDSLHSLGNVVLNVLFEQLSGTAESDRALSVEAVVTSILAYSPSFLSKIKVVTYDKHLLDMVNAQFEYETSRGSESKAGFIDTVIDGIKDIVSPLSYYDENKPNCCSGGHPEVAYNRNLSKGFTSYIELEVHYGPKTGDVRGREPYGHHHARSEDDRQLQIALKASEEATSTTRRTPTNEHKFQLVMHQSKEDSTRNRKQQEDEHMCKEAVRKSKAIAAHKKQHEELQMVLQQSKEEYNEKERQDKEEHQLQMVLKKSKEDTYALSKEKEEQYRQQVALQKYKENGAANGISHEHENQSSENLQQSEKYEDQDGDKRLFLIESDPYLELAKENFKDHNEGTSPSGTSDVNGIHSNSEVDSPNKDLSMSGNSYFENFDNENDTKVNGTRNSTLNSDSTGLTHTETEATADDWQKSSAPDSSLDSLGTTGYKDKARNRNSTDSILTCPICLCTIMVPKQLSKCGHIFCKECIERSFRDFKPVCPSCNMVYGVITGNQPEGNMDVGFSSQSLPGYEHHGTITITYSFPSGIQKESHPTPGKPYKGTTRRAYLPDCREGREILDLLRTAFDRKLTFTIGRSTTTGQEGVVTWNDIHHKTNMDGGSTKFGYPDSTYLSRVRDELTSKGVTMKSN